jgi:methylmalonyl-CoA/ethylmalonyl-CoA epimerase
MQTPDFGHSFRLHHIGLYVEKLSDYVSMQKIIKDSGQGVYLSFVKLGDSTFELLQPIDEKSPVFAAANRGQKILHLCYEVDYLDKAISSCIESKFFLVRNPVTAVAFPGQEIAWVYNKNFGLIELLGAKVK